jgi:hypothetical protein
MTAGEAEFHAEGVGLLASAGEATGLCTVEGLADHFDPFTPCRIGRR